MICITGDCHGDLRRFTARRFPAQREMTRKDYVIVCGDFGLWHDDEQERYWLKWLESKPFTLLFVDGNHENFDRLQSGEFEEVELLGGRAHRIGENIYHLMRGHVFTIEDRRFFAFGGASSHDIDQGILDPADFPSRREFRKTYQNWSRAGYLFRVNHESWWAQDLPSEAEMALGLVNLARLGWQVDHVISHCLPGSVMRSLFPHAQTDLLNGYFDELLQRGLTFRSWYCGHYHTDLRAFPQYHLLYERIVPLPPK